jgi:cation:H+ antiporter
VTGGNLLIDGALGVAGLYELPEEALGCTVVAAACCLPLLITLWSAREGDAATAVLGANLFLLLAIPGFIFYINAIPVSHRFTGFSLPAMAGAAALAITLLLTGKKLVRLEGAVFLALYAGYAVYEYLS